MDKLTIATKNINKSTVDGGKKPLFVEYRLMVAEMCITAVVL